MKKKDKDLIKELEESQKKTKEYLAGWQRTRADLLNYKKEEIKRAEEFSKYVTEDLILEILPILDNFYLVEKKLPKDLNNNEYVKGLLQIKTQLQDFLKNQGIEEIECLGKKFDPNFQEVVGEIKKKDTESGIVLEEVQKGYKLHNKVIKPVKVKISK